MPTLVVRLTGVFAGFAPSKLKSSMPLSTCFGSACQNKPEPVQRMTRFKHRPDLPASGPLRGVIFTPALLANSWPNLSKLEGKPSAMKSSPRIAQLMSSSLE